MLILRLSLGLLLFPLPPPLCPFSSLALPLTVCLSAPSERVPHSHTVNTVSHTYPVTPPGHCAIKSQSVFIQTHGISSSASHHPHLTLQSTSCQGAAVCATVPSVEKLCIYYDLYSVFIQLRLNSRQLSKQPIHPYSLFQSKKKNKTGVFRKQWNFFLFKRDNICTTVCQLSIYRCHFVVSVSREVSILSKPNTSHTGFFIL